MHTSGRERARIDTRARARTYKREHRMHVREHMFLPAGTSTLLHAPLQTPYSTPRNAIPCCDNFMLVRMHLDWMKRHSCP
eukprot:11415267-Alexandrium_andersonii.AAC.1